MEVNKVENKKSLVLTDVICDCCGESCKVHELIVDNDKRIDNGESYRTFSFMKMEATWGYFSKKDLEKWSAHICEKCVDEKFGFVKFNKKNDSIELNE